MNDDDGGEYPEDREHRERIARQRAQVDDLVRRLATMDDATKRAIIADIQRQLGVKPLKSDTI